MAGGRRNRGQYGGRNISGARKWFEVGETGDCIMDAMCQEPGCGWKLEQQRIVWWRQCVRSKGVAGGRKERGLYEGRNV